MTFFRVVWRWKLEASCQAIALQSLVMVSNLLTSKWKVLAPPLRAHPVFRTLRRKDRAQGDSTEGDSESHLKADAHRTTAANTRKVLVTLEPPTLYPS